MLPLITWAWPESAIAVAITIVLAVVLNWLINRAIKLGVEASVRHTQERLAQNDSRTQRILASVTGFSSERHEARTRTLGSVLRSVTTVVVATIAVLMVLSILGIPMGPILASAGIGGVALGFGAQSLVKDYLSGIFLILEDQFGVGDWVNLGEVSGTVEEVGLRVTRLRDANGQVWYVRNGEILRVGNLTQGWSTGTIDVPVAYDEDAGKVLGILDGVMEEVFADERWEDVLLDKPTVAGVEKVVGGTMTIRIFAKCAPNQHWGVQRDILERSVDALQRAGVRGPVLTMPPSVS